MEVDIGTYWRIIVAEFVEHVDRASPLLALSHGKILFPPTWELEPTNVGKCHHHHANMTMIEFEWC